MGCLKVGSIIATVIFAIAGLFSNLFMFIPAIFFLGLYVALYFVGKSEEKSHPVPTPAPKPVVKPVHQYERWQPTDNAPWGEEKQTPKPVDRAPNTPMSVSCPKCGEPNPVGALYCNCGARLPQK